MSVFADSDFPKDGAAPLSARQSPTMLGRGKHRGRGTRSHMAILRRSIPKHRRSPPDISPGETGDVISDPPLCNKSQSRSKDNLKRYIPEFDGVHSCHDGISVYTVNIQCLLARVAELEYQLEVHRPHVVLIQETWLCKEIKDVQIYDYVVISRRDRKDTANRGGILTLQRDDFNGLVHIGNSEIDERSWHFLRLGCDTKLLGY